MDKIKQIVMGQIAPKFKDLCGCEFNEQDVRVEGRLVHITPYECGGWYFDIEDPKDFWFEDIDSYSYQFVDFEEIVELMEWVDKMGLFEKED